MSSVLNKELNTMEVVHCEDQIEQTRIWNPMEHHWRKICMNVTREVHHLQAKDLTKLGVVEIL